MLKAISLKLMARKVFNCHRTELVECVMASGTLAGELLNSSGRRGWMKGRLFYSVELTAWNSLYQENVFKHKVITFLLD